MTVPNDWRRSIPDHWSIVPLKAVATYEVSNVDKHSKEGEKEVRLCNYSDVYHNDFITEEIDFMISTASENEIDRFQLFPDDVIITKDSESWDDIAVPAVITQSIDNLICGYHLAILRSDGERLTGRFLFHCLQSKAVRAHLELEATGITRYGIPKSAIGEVPIPLPPLSAQKQIITYLDRETARIDRLIDAKQRLLSILEEKRRAMVLTAVTRGLDAGVELRNSGVKWLGAVPVHWEVVRLATLFDQIDERGGEGLPLLEVSIKRGVAVREFSDDRIEGVAADVNSYKIVRAGELAFNKMRMWQGAVGIAPADGLVSPDYTVATIAGPILPDFAEYLFRTDAFSAECARHSRGLTWDRLRIYWDGFREISIALPPIKEQEDILTHLKNEASSLNQLGQAAEKSINLLQERRAALITAAVTGQLELSEA